MLTIGSSSLRTKKEKFDSLGVNALRLFLHRLCVREAFDNWETTDDHGMHIYGIAKDQNGKEYYMVKNSWGSMVTTREPGT